MGWTRESEGLIPRLPLPGQAKVTEVLAAKEELRSKDPTHLVFQYLEQVKPPLAAEYFISDLGN
jgi:hypothetical protein